MDDYDDEIYIDGCYGDDEYEGGRFSKGKTLNRDMYLKLQLARIKKVYPGDSKKKLGLRLLGLPRVRSSAPFQKMVRTKYGLSTDDKPIISSKKPGTYKSKKSGSKTAKKTPKSGKKIIIPKGVSKKELKSAATRIAKLL